MVVREDLCFGKLGLGNWPVRLGTGPGNRPLLLEPGAKDSHSG